MYKRQVIDSYEDWPMSIQRFEQFVKDKYDNPAGIHHYEAVQSSGKQKGDGPADYSHLIEVNSDYPGAQSVSNTEYERRLQDKKRQIKLLQPNYLNNFIDEFRLLITK